MLPNHNTPYLPALPASSANLKADPTATMQVRAAACLLSPSCCCLQKWHMMMQALQRPRPGLSRAAPGACCPCPLLPYQISPQSVVSHVLSLLQLLLGTAQLQPSLLSAGLGPAHGPLSSCVTGNTHQHVRPAAGWPPAAIHFPPAIPVAGPYLADHN